jgi:YgiT-type zinc finger domain-containing protein
MKCVICKHGETVDGSATLTIERNALTFVVKNVPARVCNNCGEEYVDEAVATELFQTAAEVAKSGAELDVRHYLKAA